MILLKSCILPAGVDHLDGVDHLAEGGSVVNNTGKPTYVLCRSSIFVSDGSETRFSIRSSFRLEGVPSLFAGKSR